MLRRWTETLQRERERARIYSSPSISTPASCRRAIFSAFARSVVYNRAVNRALSTHSCYLGTSSRSAFGRGSSWRPPFLLAEEKDCEEREGGEVQKQKRAIN
eukprot:Tamp_33928.p2 GENE.Tamp_33928~~Tamp_33928.p2  ORF type:complete len:102 (-),score=5.02 Tamp_33928:203-508(-)